MEKIFTRRKVEIEIAKNFHSLMDQKLQTLISFRLTLSSLFLPLICNRIVNETQMLMKQATKRRCCVKELFSKQITQDKAEKRRKIVENFLLLHCISTEKNLFLLCF